MDVQRVVSPSREEVGEVADRMAAWGSAFSLESQNHELQSSYVLI